MSGEAPIDEKSAAELLRHATLLVASASCTPQCLFAVGASVDRAACRCRCGEEWHGLLMRSYRGDDRAAPAAVRMTPVARRTLISSSLGGVNPWRAEVTMCPGSREALEQGCTCPVWDNAFGRGSLIDGDPDPTVYWVDIACLQHAGVINPPFSLPVRYVFGNWWLDEVTLSPLVSVTNRWRHYWIPPDRLKSEDDQSRWVSHLKGKTWYEDEGHGGFAEALSCAWRMHREPARRREAP